MGTWGNLGETRGGVEKVVCWSTKGAISLKRVKIDEKLLWRAYRNSSTLFRTVPSPTPIASPSPRLGVRNPNQKLQSLLSQERVKLRTANSIHSHVHPNKSPLKLGRKESVGVSKDCPNFLNTPYYLRSG